MRISQIILEILTVEIQNFAVALNTDVQIARFISLNASVVQEV